MATIKINTHAHWIAESATQKANNIRDRWLVIAGSIAKNTTSGFRISLTAQCLLFIPLPSLLIFYYHAPISVLAIIFILFFANIIASINGSGMRAIISIFAMCIIDLLMLVIFIL